MKERNQEKKLPPGNEVKPIVFMRWLTNKKNKQKSQQQTRFPKFPTLLTWLPVPLIPPPKQIPAQTIPSFSLLFLIFKPKPGCFFPIQSDWIDLKFKYFFIIHLQDRFSFLISGGNFVMKNSRAGKIVANGGGRWRSLGLPFVFLLCLFFFLAGFFGSTLFSQPVLFELSSS